MEKLKRIPFVVFTGAGASKAAPINLPTMFDFFQQIMDDNRQPKSRRISDRNYFKFIMDTIYDDNNDYDLERVMDVLYQMSAFTEKDSWRIFLHPSVYVEAAKNVASTIRQQFSTASSYSKNIEQAITISLKKGWDECKNSAQTLLEDMEDLIRDKYQSIPQNGIVDVYAPFFDVLAKNTTPNHAPIIPVFTTNYDMSIDWFFHPRNKNDRPSQDTWLKERKLKFVDGFDGRIEWDADNFGNIDESVNDTIFVPYCKLHGSLFWERVDGVVRRSASIARDYHLIQELMIVYPSDKKILTEDPYHFYHKMLDSYLSRANNLIVIGFSFRDPSIVQAFQYALSYNQDLIIHIINPDDISNLPEVKGFMETNNERVFYVKEYFGTGECLNALFNSV